MASATAVSDTDIEHWLSKAVEWCNTTALETQQDVCLHLPKLQEFLLQIYESLKHMGTTTVIEQFPAIGQFLGRLCWNPFIVGHEPHNVVEKKANSWIKNLVCHLFTPSGEKRDGNAEIIAQLGCSSADYYDTLLKNIISSFLVLLRKSNPGENEKAFLESSVHGISVTCIPVLTLPEVAPLLEALLHYHGPGPKEVLDDYFLEAVNDAVLRKKIVLSESAVLSLWLRHLPSLEKAVLDLFQRLIALKSKSVKEMAQIIKDSFLPKAACHPSIFRFTDNIFRNALLETEGNIKVRSIIWLFTCSFTQEYEKNNLQPKLPLKAYFPHEWHALLLALLRKNEGLTSHVLVQHLQIIVSILKNLDLEERSPESVFESWFLLIHFGYWVDIAAEKLLTSDPETSDDLLWLLAFYYNPCNENQSRTRTMVNAKSAYESLISLFRDAKVCQASLQATLHLDDGGNDWHPCTLQLIRHLCVTFLLHSPECHDIIHECIFSMTQTQEAASEVSDVLARTLCRLDIPGMESQKIITIARRLLHDF
ncbi:Fanconi anemia group C protein isoform X2 [Hyperolius riggenbachi]|uniref:Fanconi anemia group C protein isoform X2 n=1 Tax=Hyperolius riggenbachi TaxID=752182 RepID=UPI0035A39F57